MNIKHLLFAVAFIAVCSASIVANADDLLLGQYTRHDDRFYPKECNQDGKYVCDFRIKDEHPLIGINANGYTVFVMENSYERPSLSVLRTFDYDLTSNVRAYFSAGIVTGYDNKLDITWHGITPAFYPGLDIHPSHDKWGIMITIVPDYFVGIGMRFDIGEVF